MSTVALCVLMVIALFLILLGFFTDMIVMIALGLLLILAPTFGVLVLFLCLLIAYGIKKLLNSFSKKNKTYGS